MEVGVPKGAVMGMRPWAVMGMMPWGYAGKGYGSRCPEGDCNGNEAMGIYAGGREEEGGGEGYRSSSMSTPEADTGGRPWG